MKRKIISSILDRKRFIIISLSLILMGTFATRYTLLFNNNRNTSVRIIKVTMNKDFPLFYWRPRGGLDNFGDKLSHILVTSIVGGKLSTITSSKPSVMCKRSKLLAIGSVLQWTCHNDVIWGSGIVNPSVLPSRINSKLLRTVDIRAVRGPRTRNLLISKFNVNVPEIYGDPALLLPYYLTSYKKFTKPSISVLLILHYRDVERKTFTSGLNRTLTVHALLPWNDLLSLIVRSELVVSTSLHGVIVSEAFGVPARTLKSPHVELFKFYDYYEGTNRTFRYAKTIDQAIRMGGEKPLNIDLTPLLNAFPAEKFGVYEKL